MKIFTQMSNEHLNNAIKIAQALKLGGEYILQAQVESKISKDDLLSVFVDEICSRLRREVPSCTINGKKIIIDTLGIIRILNEFCGYFLCYLNKDSISRLEIAIDIHLQNTKQQVNFHKKIDIGIIPASIHKICKHTSTIVDSLKQYGFTFIYCVENRNISFDTYVLYADCLYLYMFDLNGIVSAFNLRLYRLKESPKIFYVNHVFNSILKQLCWKKEEKYFYNSILQTRLLRSHYHLCHSKSEVRLLELSCEKYKIDKSCIIKSGYPSFDVSFQSYNAISPILCGGGGRISSYSS